MKTNDYLKYIIVFTLIISAISIYYILDTYSQEYNDSTISLKNINDQPDISSKYNLRERISSSVPENPVDQLNSDNIRETIESFSIDPLIDKKWRIIDNCNNPRAGVHVVCTPISRELIKEWLSIDEEKEVEPDLHETYTDDNGCFDFPNLRPGCYLIRGDAQKWSPALGILNVKADDRDEFTAAMAKEKVIQGIVLDCNQQPISEAIVYCYMSPTYPIENMPLDHACEVILFDQQLLTDEKGHFIFKGLFPSRDYDLYVKYKGCIPLDKTVMINDLNEQVLTLKRSCILEGRITSYDGTPLEDAVIDYCQPQSPLSYILIKNIDRDGRFRCDNLPEGVIHLQGKHKDYGHDVLDLNLQVDKTNYAELKLPKGIKVRIAVTDEQGFPLEGMRVTVIVQDTGATLFSSLTDESGKVVVPSLNIGAQTSIFVRDLQERYSIYDKTYIFNDDRELQVKLIKRIPNQLIVKDKSNGEIVSDYKLCFCSYYKSSVLQERNSLSSFTFEKEIKTPVFDFKIAKGEFFEITIMAIGYMPERVMAMVPENGELKPIEVFLEPGKVLNGCVYDSVTSKPVSGAMVQLYVNGMYDKKPGYPLSNTRAVVTDDNGVFSLHDMPDFRYFLKVSASKYTPQLVDSYELDTSSIATDNRIYLIKGGSLSGKVYTQNEYPLDQAYIQIRLAGTNELITTRSAPDGSYILDDIPPGEHIVSAWDVLGMTTSRSTMKLQRSVEIREGQVTIADFNFDGSCIIRGLCTVDGEEGCGIVINLYDSNGVQTHSVDASNTGYYKITGLKHGVHILEAQSTLIGAGGVIRKTINLARCQDLTLNLDFDGKAICGTVTNASGEPLHAAEIELLTPAFKRNYLTNTDTEGCYAIFNVDEGNYFIVARAPGCGEEMKGPYPLKGNGKQARKVDFILKQGGAARIHVNSQGSPLPDSTIFVSNNLTKGVLWKGKTKYTGIAIFDNLPTESLSAVAKCKGYAPSSITFIAPAGEITDTEINLIKGGTFNLEVKDVSGLPVAEAQVVLIGYSPLGISINKLIQLDFLKASSSTLITDEKGKFTLGLLPPGEYKVVISKGIRYTETLFIIRPDKETNIRIDLQ